MPRPWDQVPCMRLTPDGVVLVEFRYPGKEVEIWIDFNRRNRPREALFVSDKLEHPGDALTEEQAISLLLTKRGPGPSRRIVP